MKKFFQKTSTLKIDLKNAIKKILKTKNPKSDRKVKRVEPVANELEKIEDWFPHEYF